MEEKFTESLRNLSIGDQIQEYSKFLLKTTDELHQQVRDKHNALLQQATHAGRFDVELNVLVENVKRVREFSCRLKNQIDSQYQLMNNQSKVLGRLHELSYLLRSTGTLLILTLKLKTTKDVLKQAELHYELASLIRDQDLKNIEFIQNDLSYVINSGQKIRNLTQMQLVTGLQGRSQNQVIKALKVFINFNVLEKALENLNTTLLSNFEQSLKECFAGTDISVLNKSESIKTLVKVGSFRGPGKTQQFTTTQNFRAKFWKSLHWLLYNELYESCDQMKLLKKCLEEIPHFGKALELSQSIQNNFWQAIQSLLQKYIIEAPAHVTQILQEGLSKLLTSVRGLELRLNCELTFKHGLFESLESGYVSKCAANIKACLVGIDLPSNETIDNLVRVAATEISASLIDKQLSKSVANVFIVCGNELCTKVGGQIKLGSDSRQIVDIPNSQQIRNILVANILYYYKDSVQKMLQDLSEHFSKSKTTAKYDITKSLEQIDMLMRTILQQIMDSMLSAITIIILSMHREPGLNTDKISTAGPSMYIKELIEFVKRTWTNHVQVFDDKITIEKCGDDLAKRCIDIFIHNLCILRPLSIAGRQRLKNDCAHMEQALKIMCPNLLQLGRPVRLLRALSFLIVQTPTELKIQDTNANSLVPNYIILFLLFGHAESELQSPHTVANWSNDYFIEWLHAHSSERERLDLISVALHKYRDIVRRKNSEQYDEVFPIIVQFFEKAYNMNV